MLVPGLEELSREIDRLVNAQDGDIDESIDESTKKRVNCLKDQFLPDYQTHLQDTMADFAKSYPKNIRAFFAI